ncbi:hypothetical protein I551_8227 [Mycobacterium ulcerans str. Harvey]|uniref:Uncharacterized protein n=1 Tax=Mycobacterium ulcerans str. Harvey TaxID=1299332 RepID=A0ABN0QL36_MYCUL|nr:hypothetical protein I551_8227 [Mycobacterium ulcerans str. Harvey]
MRLTPALNALTTATPVHPLRDQNPLRNQNPLRDQNLLWGWGFVWGWGWGLLEDEVGVGAADAE